jgi:hypothetical protein
MITEPVRQIAEPQAQCRLIRSKWMFIDAEPDPTVPRSGTSICWCVQFGTSMFRSAIVRMLARTYPNSPSPGQRRHEAVVMCNVRPVRAISTEEQFVLFYKRERWLGGNGAHGK